MSGRGRWLTAGIALAALLVLGYRWLGGDDGGGDGRDAAGSPVATTGADASTADAASPFATREETALDETSDVATTADEESVPSVSTDAANEPPLDLAAIGRSDIPDDEFEALAARLARDPELLRALIDEFRAETDPERRARLARLLGDVDDPQVTLLATELVYSGDDESRLLGLDLLKRIAPGNADVRDVVSGLLSSESDERILVGTLTVMARPGAADADTRAGLAGQVSLLSDHADPRVRRTSLDILSRWSDAPEHTSVVLAGLADEDQSVRRTAAYAMVGREDSDGSAARGLLAVATNENEEERTRRGAILALKGMALEPDVRERVLETERALDRRPR